MDMPSLTTLRIESSASDPIARLVLDRPDKLNALSRVLLDELVTACRWLDSQRHLKVVVVQGAGRSFSAGFDLQDFGTPSADYSVRDTADLGRLAADALTDIGPLTIACLHGHCVGGGLVLAAACDLRVAASDARFSIPEVDLGIPLAWGGIPRLVRELGPAITKELVLTCRPFSADEAHQLRFVNTVVAPDDLERTVTELAVSLAAKPGFALRTTKQQVNAVLEEMAGTGRNASDADTLAAAIADPESIAASRRYLADRTKRGKPAVASPAAQTAQPGGLVTVASPYGVAETLQRLTATANEAGATIFATIDHAAGARSVGLDMPETQVLVLGNPAAGTPAMLGAPDLALELPTRLLVRAEASGTTVMFHDPNELAEKFGLGPAETEHLQRITGLVERALGPA